MNAHRLAVQTLACVLVAAVVAAVTVAESSLDKAKKAFESGKYVEVIDLSKREDKASKDWTKITYLAGEAELVLSRFQDAKASFLAVLEKNHMATPARVGAARALIALGETDAAKPWLDEQLQLNARDLVAQTTHGELQARLGNDAEARKSFAKALAIDPKSSIGARAYFEFLAQQDDDKECAKLAAAFIKARADHPLGYFMQAVALERANHDKQAIEAYEKALAKDDNYLDAHKNLAILCHTLSNTYQIRERVEKAYAHYESYFRLGGTDPKLKEMFDALMKYKKDILNG